MWSLFCLPLKFGILRDILFPFLLLQGFTHFLFLAMENDARVRKLVEVLCGKDFGNTEEVTTPDSSISTEISNDSFMRLQGIFGFKELNFHTQWKHVMNYYCDFMFHSHPVYLKCVIFSCLKEARYYENVFEAFITVCAFLKFFNETILDSTGMNFRDLNTDVFMVVYDAVMKRKFCEEGGLQKFMEYVDGHGYFSWKWKDLKSTDAAARPRNLENIQLETEMNSRLANITMDEIETMDETSNILVPKVLSATAFPFPTLSNNPALIKDLKEDRNEEIIEKNKRIVQKAVAAFVHLKATSQRCSSSNSDSQTDHAIIPENNPASAFVDSDVTRQGCSNSNSDSKTDQAINPANNPLLGKPILAVLRHYHSIFSDPANSDNPIQKKADGSM